MATAKILVLNGIGPVLVTVVSENLTQFEVTNPVQLRPVNDQEMEFAPLLDFMVSDNEVHTIYKSAVTVSVNPNPQLAEGYLKSMNPSAIFTPPEKKIII